MGKYHPPAIIETFSPLWWEATLVTLLVIALIVLLPKYIKPLQHKMYGLSIGLIMLANTIGENIYNYVNGYWNLQQNLPIHLCSISSILCVVVMFNYKQRLAECVYYWGLAGGIQSLLTPEFTVGMEGFNFIGYYISHGGLILVVMYMIVHLDFKPRSKSWLHIFGYTQLVALSAVIINYLVGSNYLFLAEKPIVKNPLLIGDWPYYIIVLEFVAVLHFWVLYLPFARKNKTVIA
jgi:hypothetical integral membrane protein (TIGR02206 family)